jgi:RimJ/RimL family protein N-acetyltransferase
MTTQPTTQNDTPTTVFRQTIDGRGTFALRPLAPDGDAELVHDWVSRPYAQYWGMQNLDVAGVAEAYREIVEAEHSAAYLGYFEGEPSFILETYRPDGEPVGKHYAVQPGDRGMHILIAPPRERLPDFTWHVFRVILDFLFSDPAVERIVVEPDATNEAIHRLNRRAGFRYQGNIELPEKTASLAFCTRDDYRAALAEESTS